MPQKRKSFNWRVDQKRLITEAGDGEYLEGRDVENSENWPSQDRLEGLEP